MEVRCEYATPPHTQGHQALDLAIEFYMENCTECPYRDGTGELPNLATEAANRAAREVELKVEEQRRADERAARYRDRRERRQQAMIAEDLVARELARHLDHLDRAEPRTGPLSVEERRAERHIIEAAKAAPDLFSPVLIDTLLELASDTADTTAFAALVELVRGGRCPPRRALDSALAALRRYRSIEASHLVGFLSPELVAADLPDVVDQLINLASGDEDHWRPPAAPAGLAAAAHVDLPFVTNRITKQLASDDEWDRHKAADAARVLLTENPTRVIALGVPLALSIRGPDVVLRRLPAPFGGGIERARQRMAGRTGDHAHHRGDSCRRRLAGS
jgi:hypothetical protein